MAGGRSFQRLQKVALDALSNITIEPIMFLQYTAYYTQLVIRDNLKLERFCRVTLKYPAEECAQMNDGHHTDLQVKAQQLDSVFTFYEKLASTIIPILLLSFIASWSDKRGRRVPILLSLLGQVLYSIIYLLEAFFTSWSPYVLLLAYFLQSIGGGLIMFAMACYSYMADNTSRQSRTARMTIMNIFWHLGCPIGTVMGAWIFDIGGYVPVFSTSLIFYSMALVVAFFIVKDKQLEKNETENDTEMETSPWNPKNVISLLRVATRTRPGRTRLHLLLLLVFMLCYMSSVPHNMYLWTRRVFQWDQNQYSLYSTASMIAEVLVMLIATLIFHRYTIHDCVIGAGTALLIFLEDLSFGLVGAASQWWVVLVFLVVPSILCPITIRSQITKLCDDTEVGRYFSLLAILEVLWPLADGAIYSAVYTYTIAFYPSCEHLVSAAFTLCLMSGFLGLRLYVDSAKGRPSPPVLPEGRLGTKGPATETHPSRHFQQEVPSTILTSSSSGCDQNRENPHMF
ncbi:lysosomal proton-coupled steroid conjugate and bile acid symporter SLC46A3 [Procambarus clarkii]|uniref:lysosomal proton-coupled steroid conjugate and bile acid symporter SLC46A3 n=1 Tax=Procambarus clarkii TaxID=6728 RepID=UPI0037445F80